MSTKLRKFTVTLTDEEFEFLSKPAVLYYRKGAAAMRCSGCNHLSVLHNTHCCTFCTVPNCDCTKDVEWSKQ